MAPQVRCSVESHGGSHGHPEPLESGPTAYGALHPVVCFLLSLQPLRGKTARSDPSPDWAPGACRTCVSTGCLPLRLH